MVKIRVAVIAGSISGGFRVAREIESMPGVDLFVVACNVGKRRPLLRWSREILSALKSPGWVALASKAYRYAREARLVILHHPLDEATSIDCLRSLQCDIGLHAANVICREPVISAFRLGILNAHIGILPKYRGRSVAEWSVLQGDPTGVTVFFIDPGIDTGDCLVLREFVPSREWRSVQALKKYVVSVRRSLVPQSSRNPDVRGMQLREQRHCEGAALLRNVQTAYQGRQPDSGHNSHHIRLVRNCEREGLRKFTEILSVKSLAAVPAVPVTAA